MPEKGGEEKKCGLCGLDLGRNPFSRLFDGREIEFCCIGCLNVFTILTESGIIAKGENIRETEIFRQSLALGLIANPLEKEERFEIPADAPVKETLLQVSGMWCSACSWLIEHTLKKERGIISAEAFFTSDLVKVKYCPQYLPPEKLAAQIRKLGYKAEEFDPDSKRSNEERRDLVLRIGIAAFLWSNIMTLSVPLYVGYFEEISPSIKALFPFILMVLAAPVVFYSAMPIINIAWKGLLNKKIRMETLLATGILAAYFYSSIQAFRGETLVYFDTAAAIVTLVLLGKLMEKAAKERTTRSISMLYRLMPKKVRLFSEGREKFVSVEALQIGDEFIVKSGERIPADGRVIEGLSHVDESLLTGESNPIEKKEGSIVVSGSLNVGNLIIARATKVGGDTTLSQIIRLVEGAISSRSGLERTVDKVSRVFVPSVILVSVAAFLACYGLGFTTIDEALMRGITILVIACPCALGLATPLAITAAVGNASRHGVLISDSSILEKIRSLDVVVFDKTGTITEGRFELTDMALAQEASMGKSFMSASEGLSGHFSAPSHQEGLLFESLHLPMIAALERFSEHPLGRAVLSYAEGRVLNIPEAREINVEKGLGICGSVGPADVLVGNKGLFKARGIRIDSQLLKAAENWERAGKTAAFYGFDGRAAGALAFGDSLKDEAKETISKLREQGIKIMVISGDSEETTSYIAREAGADSFIAGALPSGKTEAIREMQASGLKVAMIGDGINDAPALAQADLGIAMGSGADIAMKAADVVLMGGSLRRIFSTFYLAEKTGRIVCQNLFWAFFYNTLGMALAVTGVLNPIMAAGAMFLSSLSVIGNSMRLNRNWEDDSFAKGEKEI